MNSKGLKRESIGIQFSLSHMFLATFLLAACLGLDRSAGRFMASLVVGGYLLYAVIVIFRIREVVLGVAIGALLAAVYVLCAGAAFASRAQWVPLVCIAYPVVGAVVGAVGASRAEAE